MGARYPNNDDNIATTFEEGKGSCWFFWPALQSIFGQRSTDSQWRFLRYPMSLLTMTHVGWKEVFGGGSFLTWLQEL